MNDTKTLSLEELRAMRNRGETKTKPTANEVDMADGFWDDAELVAPLTKTAISLRVDADVLDFFKSQGKGHLTRMNAVLRTYVEAQKTR